MAAPAGAAPPRRVVSMNLCTDQLAMLLAAEGQLVSVSALARDPRSSSMPEAARDYPVNHGRAEEIYLLDPDLVLVGSFTSPATVDMLRRIGVPVEVFDPAYTFDDIRDRMLRMGKVLGREAAAQRMVESFDADLAALRTDPAEGPRAALYEANGYTSGSRTLSGQILAAAGFRNVADEAGLQQGGMLPLELLAMADPDLLIASVPYPGASRAEEVLDHPVVRRLRAEERTAVIEDADWVCGTPHVLDAVADLAEARQALDAR